MDNKFRYLKREDRKKILLLCDDIRMPSGVATMGREIVVNTAHHFNWVNLGAGVSHPDKGKMFDMSEEINKLRDIQDADVRLIPSEGYGTVDVIRQLIQFEKPDAIMIFTDPRYWTWLFDIEREIRSVIPIFYLNIWDNFPAPMYNKSYYESVDLLMAISKQTKLINELVLGESAKDKLIEYVPHGINSNYFYPIVKTSPDYKAFVEFKKQLYSGKDIQFSVFFNSRNIRRKSPGDLILGYRLFCDMIGKEAAKKCALVLHTETVLDAGTDLVAVKNHLTDPEYVNIYFSDKKLTTTQMNLLYNSIDVTILPSSNEGWGLSMTESMMTGKMIIGTVTGGIQDQMRFEDENGQWYTPTSNVPSNHLGTYKNHGEWAVPIFPASRTLVGSPLTPYIFEDHVTVEDIALAIKQVYDLTPEERDRRGIEGHKWVMSEESNMSAERMGGRVIESIDKAFERFIPRDRFEVSKVEPVSNLIQHKLTGF
jgi:glycosyltransferase involved in cell wall biosynthesis